MSKLWPSRRSSTFLICNSSLVISERLLKTINWCFGEKTFYTWFFGEGKYCFSEKPLKLKRFSILWKSTKSRQTNFLRKCRNKSREKSQVYPQKRFLSRSTRGNKVRWSKFVGWELRKKKIGTKKFFQSEEKQKWMNAV